MLRRYFARGNHWYFVGLPKRKHLLGRALTAVVGGLALAGLLLAPGGGVAAAPEGSGPPAFVTLPVMERVAPPGVESHFVFDNDSIGPGLHFAPALKPGSAGPANFTGGASLSTTPTNVNVSNAAGSYQGETGGASNGSVVVAGSNNIYPGACGSNNCGVLAYTLSNGIWTTSPISRTWNNNTFGITFDPSLDYDSAGNFYYAFGGAPLSGSYPNSVAVAKSGPDGVSWGTPVAVTYNPNKFFDDKYYIAVDRSGSSFANRVYVAWDRNTATNQILYVAYSSDGGASWSGPIKANDGNSKFERVIDAYPAVDQGNGTVYVSWLDYAKNKIYVDKSGNGGASWGTDVAAATTHTGFGQDIGCNGGRKQSPAHHLKVGPSGTLHLVYADSIQGRGYDILYTQSRDGGAHWSTPVRLNDDSGAAHQYHPTLSVTGNGTATGDVVTVSFYDRRDDSGNCLSHVYATQSLDGGATWSANVRLTTDSSNFDGNPNGPGDYSSSTPSSAGVFPFHSDHRTTTGADTLMEIYTEQIP